MELEDTELSPGNWKGIGLTDPIKNVEVSNRISSPATLIALYSGQMAASSSIFEG